MSANPTGVRLLPALIVTMAAVLSLRAAATAQSAYAAEGEAKDSAPKDRTPAQKPEASGADAAQAAPASETTAAPTCPVGGDLAKEAGLTPNELAVLESLSERRKQLDAREAGFADQIALLDAAEKRVAERVAELKELEEAVNALLGQLDEQEEKRVAALVNVYQKMRAKDAAAIFDALDDAVLLQVAARMKEQNLAEIMGEMQPAAARKLTEMLAETKKPPEAAASAPEESAQKAQDTVPSTVRGAP